MALGRGWHGLGGYSGWRGRWSAVWHESNKSVNFAQSKWKRKGKVLIEGAESGGAAERLLCLHCQQSRKSVRITQNSRHLPLSLLSLCLSFIVPACFSLCFCLTPCSSIIRRRLFWWLWHLQTKLEAGRDSEQVPCGTDKVSAPSCSLQLPLH